NQGEYAKAVADFNEALRLDPTFQAARSGLALLLASCPDPALRDGKRAVALATEAYESARPEEPVFCSTLAAAYAETGDFDRAAPMKEKAVRLTLNPAEQDDSRARLALYRAGKPYRQTSPRGDGGPADDKPRAR